ncbi:hypothetical protein MML48_4g00008076 [Holotrichia oblita]|uniref:Uncharacterized protein n=1 Tax=Holotrichia oblita TaxID=644536 RepID=A0ACB9T8P1_HOLOL|nr:hypothetical protein MML48_4g00008076 [Holotrichia oblita]
MPRKRILKTDRVNIDESLIKQAIVSVFNGTLSERAAARTHGIKRSTLQSRIKKVLTKYSKHDFLKKTLQRDVDSGNESEGEDSPKYSNKYTTARQVFTTDEELQLENYIKKCSDMNYGLSYVDIEKLAFQFARALPHCKIPPEWQEAQKAKLGWRQGFMKRHPTLSLRKPESTSLSRSIAFNKHKINQFFDNYLHVLQRYKFTSDKIYNLDETGVTTVMKPVRIVATCGKKQVSQVASAERGELVTFVGIISAAGDNIPPIYIFPRLRNLGDLYMHNAPDNSLALGNKSGWMTAELFPEALKHVKKHTKCHPNDPILLLCDNHESHVSLASILFCRENGIVLLTFPPHTTHRLQPLDVGVFGPFKVYCNTTFNDWLISNPGKTISVKNIAYLTNLPFEKAFTRTNIKNSFKKPGIWPLNRLVFSDEDFASNYVTDMTEESISKSQGNRGNHQQNAEETEQQDELDKILNIEHEDPNKVLATNTEMVKEKEITDESNSPCTSKAARNILKDKKITPAIVRPFPKIAERRKKGKREPGKSRIMTDTPERDRLEEKENEKNIKKTKNVRRKLVCEVQTKKVLNNKRKKIEDFESSSSDSDLSPTFNESDDDISDDLDDVKELSKDSIKERDFVLVKFPVKNIIVHFVGQILKTMENKFEVKFLRRKGLSSTFYFPTIDDISVSSIDDIIAKLVPSSHVGTARTLSYFRFCYSFGSLLVN